MLKRKKNFMKYKNHRSEPYFTFLKNGQKTIEGRIRKEKYAEISAGDLIDVFNNKETDFVKVKVKRVTKYESIKEMLTKEPLKKVLPDMETLDQGIEVYKKFYTEAEEKQYGVVAIEVEVQ
jgi:ASC-1-like (ASCH) protein